jgi:hypothetical protein
VWEVEPESRGKGEPKPAGWTAGSEVEEVKAEVMAAGADAEENSRVLREGWTSSCCCWGWG